MSATRTRRAACALAAAAIGAGLLGGCAKMNAALGQQWITVDLAPTTTLASARHVTAACSHLPGVRPYPVKPTAPGGIVGFVRFDTTNASAAATARLQRCLQKFPAVQDLTVGEPGS